MANKYELIKRGALWECDTSLNRMLPSDLWQWCHDNFGYPGRDSRWDFFMGRIILFDEDDAVLFKLAWP